LIIKSFELKKKFNKDIDFYLLYGPNDGLKNEIILNNLIPIFSKNIYRFDEKDIIENLDTFEESIYNKSLFEENRLIIIDRASNKIFPIVEKIISQKTLDLKIIIKADLLDKKSKLRNFFEKSSSAIIVPIYEDTYKTLIEYAQNFLKEENIKISNENINLIVNRSKDRINLENQLKKISIYCKRGNKLEYRNLIKLVDSTENFNISELVDNSLAKYQGKVLNIINENTFNQEDYIIILRTFLNKLKRLRKINERISSDKKNIEQVINSFKPTIFWKEKEIIKQQLKNLSFKKINSLIYKINNLEFLIKKNNQFAHEFINNFLLENLKKTNNSV